MNDRPISRRTAIILGALGAAGATTGWLAASRVFGTVDEFRPETDAELHEPLVLDSDRGLLSVELVAAAGATLAGRTTQALGFNGTTPGPTLRVRPGDEIALRLTNRLQHPTNLHTHGLRVSPEGNGDNPFLRIDPGASFDYRYRVPHDHPPGTHWYHPHHHGTVADQVFGGLIGALVVDGGDDLDVGRDRILLVSDIDLDADGRVSPVTTADRMNGREGELVLVNGQHQPTIPAVPGESQRWRIVNCCTSRVLAIDLDGHQLVQVALDGSFLPTPLPRDQVLLAPGNRADVVVRPAALGRHALTATPVDRGGMGAMMGGRAATDAVITLATMVTDGPVVTSPALPSRLPGESASGAAVTRTRRIRFQGGMGAGGMAFTIDGRLFDPTRDDHTIPLGTTEEWTIVNSSPMAHPFHLHVWPFTVLATGDGAATTGVAQDVVLVPARSWVRLRIPFTDIAGRTVFHCHVLDHEDAGMMATVNVHR